MEIRRSILLLILAAFAVLLFTGCPPAEEPVVDEGNGDEVTPVETGDGGETAISPEAGGPDEGDYMASYTGMGAEQSGSESCMGCHADQAPGEGASHASYFDGDEANPLYGTGCEQCHGPGGNHNGDPLGIVMPPKMGLDDVVGMCSMCHATQGGFEVEAFKASTHYGAGISCTACHSGHAETDAYLSDADSNNICAQCHADMITAMADGTHGVADGQCTMCHNPHKDM